jgi:hypothetical protein
MGKPKKTSSKRAPKDLAVKDAKAIKGGVTGDAVAGQLDTKVKF